MGSVCCCLREEDFRDYINPNSSAYRNCICLGCFLQNFMSLYATIFQREVRSIPSSVEGAASLTSTQSLDNSFEDTFHSPPRPLPYDADHRLHRSQQGGIVSRREKGSSHLEEETAPLRSSNDIDSGSLNAGGKWDELDCVEGSKKLTKSLQKLSLAKTTTGVTHVDSYSSFEDEDVCPTCLEEYTPENPKIITKCSHHFHLGCIYEWMERSDSCPVCGKVMEFNETT